MLNGLTPREAAKIEASRNSVVDWLKYIENGNEKNKASAYDMSWMWEELGLGAYRR